MRKTRLHVLENRITRIILFLAVCSLSFTISYAAVPHYINYQGRLTDASGTPLNGSYNITFKIYDDENAGNLLWQEEDTGVSIEEGIFSITLGSVSSLNLSFDRQYWLEIKVGDEVMSPRQRLSTSGYAIRAEKAEDANTISNIGVNTTPTPDKLLPLDNNGRLPGSQGLLGNNIVVLSGVINDGATIPLPAGYTESQCRWMVSYANTVGAQSAAWDNWLWIKCYTTGRAVTCLTGSSGPGGVPYPADANYIIIGVK